MEKLRNIGKLLRSSSSSSTTSSSRDIESTSSSSSSSSHQENSNNHSMTSQHNSTNSVTSWLNIGYKSSKFSELNDPRELSAFMGGAGVINATNLIGILRRATELKSDEFTIASLDTIISTMQASLDPDLKTELGSHGIANLLDILLSQRMASKQICEPVLKVICALLTDEANRSKFFSSGFCYRLIKTCQLHSNEPSLLLWGLRILRLLTLDDSLISKFAVSGACELVASVLHHHRDKEDEIVEWSCRVIYNICYEDGTCSSKLADCGVCEIIVSLLRPKRQRKGESSKNNRKENKDSSDDNVNNNNDDDENDEDNDTSVIDISTTSDGWDLNMRKYQYLILAMGSVCRRNDSNKERLGWLGACEVVMQVGEHFGTNDVMLAESIVWTLSTLSFPCLRNQQQLCELGAAQLVVSILNQHISSEKCVIECLRAIRNIGQDCDPALDSLKQSGVSKGVINVLRAYPDSPTIVQWSWYAIGSLAHYSSLGKELGELNVCKLAGDFISKFNMEDDIVQWIALAVGELARDSTLNRELCNEGLVSLLVESLSVLCGNAEVVEECCIAISILLSTSSVVSIESNSSYAIAFSDSSKFYVKQQVVSGSNICELLMKLWSIYEKNEFVIQESSKVLASLVQRPAHLNRNRSSSSSTSNEETKHIYSQDESLVIDKFDNLISSVISVKLVSGNFVKLLPKILSRYVSNGIIIESCFLVLSELLEFADMKLKLASLFGSQSSFYNIIATCLQHHIDVVHTCELGCRIISYLSAESSNLVKLAKSLSSTQMNLLPSFSDPLLEISSTGANTGIGSNVNAGYSTGIILSSSSSAAVAADGATDCATVLINLLSRHYKYYYELNMEEDFISSDNDTNKLLVDDYITDTNNSEINLKTQDNQLAVGILMLIGDLSSRNSVLRIRFGAVDGCLAILSCLLFHKRRKKVVITGCTTLSNLASSVISSSDSNSFNNNDLLGNSQRLSDNNVCELISELLDIYSKNQEVMYFLCICIDSVCNLNCNRSKLCELHVCSILLSSINEFKLGEGFVSEALSALGSLYEAGSSRLIAQQQLVRKEDMEILKEVIEYYLQHPVICQCFCRLIAFMTAGPNHTIQNLLFQNGLVDILVNILEKYSDDALDCVKFTLLAIANVSFGNVEVSELLHSHRSCRIIVQILQKNYSIDFIAEGCCRAISSGLSIYSSEFGKLGACELVLLALNTHPSSSAVLEWVCRAIGVLAENKANVIILCDNHAPENIVATLQQHLQYEHSLIQLSKKVLFKSNGSNGNSSSTTSTITYGNDMGFGSGHTTILHTINNSNFGFNIPGDSNSPSNSSMSIGFFKSVGFGLSKLNIFSTSSSSSSKVMNKYSDNQSSTDGSVLWGVMAIYYMLKGSDCDPTYQQILFDNGICDIIYKLLLKYEENEAIALACCKAIVPLIKNNLIIANRFGAVGVCTQIVEVMQIYPSSEKISRWASHAVALLAANDNEANISRLASAGICETIPVAIQAHQTSSNVALYGCEVIFRLTNQDATGSGLGGRLGHSGACEAVVSVLRKHSSNVTVMEMASKAIANLAYVTGNASWFGPAGACDALLSVVRIHELKPKVVANCWEAISNLCSIDFNRVRLFNLNIGETIVKSLRTHHDSIEVSEYAGRLVGRLCEYRSSTTQLLGRTDEFPTFFLPKSLGNDNISMEESELVELSNYENNMLILSKILNITPGNRQSLLEAGVIEPLLNVLVIHGSVSSRVCYNIVKAISVLAHGKESICERFLLGHLGACEIIVDCMRIHREDIGVSIVCVHAIRALCSENYLGFDFVNLSNISAATFDAQMNLSSSTTIPEVSVSISSDMIDHNNVTAVEVTSSLPSSTTTSIAGSTMEDIIVKVGTFVSLIQKLNQGRIRRAYGCDLIVDVLKYHLVNMLPSTSSTHLNSNSSTSTNIGIQQRYYKPSRHIDGLVEGAAWATAKLCEKGAFHSRDILGSHGICEIFVDILQAVQRGTLSFEITFYIIMALTQLSMRHTRNINRLGFTSLGEHLCVICNKHMSNFGTTVDTSTTNPINLGIQGAEKSSVLGYESSMSVIDKTKTVQGNEYDTLLEYIIVLTANVCGDRVGQHRFGSAGLCRIFVLLTSKYEKSLSFTSLIAQAIAALAWQFPENQNRLGVAGACKGLITVLERHLLSTVGSSQGSYLQYLGISNSSGYQQNSSSFRKVVISDLKEPNNYGSTHGSNRSENISSPTESLHGITNDISVIKSSTTIDEVGSDISRESNEVIHSARISPTLSNDEFDRNQPQHSTPQQQHLTSTEGEFSTITDNNTSVVNTSVNPIPIVAVGNMEDTLPTPRTAFMKKRSSAFFSSFRRQSQPAITSSNIATSNIVGGKIGSISRPNLLIDGFSAVSCLSRGHEVNRSKFQASSLIDILTAFLSLEVSDPNFLLAKACAEDAMDAIIRE